MKLLTIAASAFERYITLNSAHSTKTYNYAARNIFDWPVINATRHRPKCAIGESWLYVAIPAGARLDALNTTDKLYVGAQTQDRMFRGDGLGGDNFHHAEMRTGNKDENLVTYLKTGKAVEVHRVQSAVLANIVNCEECLWPLKPLLLLPRTPKKHLGYWFEQYILSCELKLWRWNSAAADRALTSLILA